MTSLLFKVDEKIVREFDLIKQQEGLGNRTSAFAFLVKYYLLTRKKTLEESIALMNRLLDKIDPDSLPSLEEQLADL